MLKALCIEDDQTAAQEIAAELTMAGFEVQCFSDGRAGLQAALTGQFDVITLDRMLPGMDGLAIVSALRASGATTPVLMISALSHVDERVKGLRAGGDDYLTKPFASEEMAARVEVLLRRNKSRDERETVIQFDDLSLDLLKREMRCGQQRCDLQATEFKLLELLLRNANKTVTRALIFEAVWGYHFDPGTKLIDVHLTRLRRKLEAIGCRPSITTIRGSGFVLASV